MIFAECPVRILKLLRRAGLVGAVLMTASACDIPISFPTAPSGGFDPCPGGESPATSFKLKASAITLRPGQSAEIGFEIRNAQGVFASCTFPEWSTGNPEIATVSFGHVTGLKDGTTVVRATWSTFVDSAVVTVKTPVITGVWITLPSSLLVGQTAGAKMIIESADNVAGIPVVYSSKDPAKAIVSSTGMVTSLADGVVDIVAVVGGISASHRLTITRDAPRIRFSAIDAGAQHTCGLVGGGGLAEGTAVCWGSGWAGGLGNGRNDNAFTPVIVSAAPVPFKAITSGEAHTCALSTDGDAYCWGSNFSGEIGDNTTIHRLLPVKVLSSVKFASISAGLGHTCALTSDARVYCWGIIHKTSSVVPVRVEGLPRITQLSSEKQRACGLTDIGEVYCWGEGDGLVVKTSQDKPTKVANGMTFKSIASGGYHTCGLRENGSVYCWGMNATGQIDPARTGAVADPFLVSGGFSFRSIAAGGLVTCGITVSTGTRCLGQTMLGNTPGGRALSMLEIPRESEHPFVAITSGQFHTCAIDDRGGAWCWGEQRFGAVGAGEGQTVDQPLQVRIEQ